MTSDTEFATDMLDRDSEQSSLLLIVVGASALFWGIVYLLLV
ncbi:MAG: hypothetical protein ABW023_07400 [Sphingomonas sp.]